MWVLGWANQNLQVMNLSTYAYAKAVFRYFNMQRCLCKLPQNLLATMMLFQTRTWRGSHFMSPKQLGQRLDCWTLKNTSHHFTISPFLQVGQMGVRGSCDISCVLVWAVGLECGRETWQLRNLERDGRHLGNLKRILKRILKGILKGLQSNWRDYNQIVVTIFTLEGCPISF